MLALYGGLELCRELATKPLRPAGTTSSVSTAQAAEDAADNVEARFNAGLVARFAVGVAFKHRTRHLRMPHFRASSCLGYSHAIRDPGSWLRTLAKRAWVKLSPFVLVKLHSANSLCTLRACWAPVHVLRHPRMPSPLEMRSTSQSWAHTLEARSIHLTQSSPKTKQPELNTCLRLYNGICQN